MGPLNFLRKLFSFFWHGSAALAGFLLLPIASAIKILILAFVVAGMALVLVPLISFVFLPRLVIDELSFRSVFREITIGLRAFIGLSALALVFIPLMTVIGLGIGVISSAVDGMVTGWNEGFLALIRKAFTPLFIFSWIQTHQEEEQIQNLVQGLNDDDEHVQDRQTELGNHLYQLLTQLFTEANNRPINQGDLKNYKCTGTEVEKLQKEYQILDTNEERNIKEYLEKLKEKSTLSPDEIKHKALIERYLDVKERLNDRCPITLEVPEKSNAVLLVKQYYDGSTWLPVPNGAQIFDRESLEGWLKTKAVHPTTRENIVSPEQYDDGHKICNTRYRYHPYYIDIQGRQCGVSQELNNLASLLKNSLPILKSSKSDQRQLDDNLDINRSHAWSFF